MKRWRISLFIAFMAILNANIIAQVSGFDQVGTTSFQFLSVIPNARAAAMGGVATATIGTSDAVFFNPAALTNTSQFDVGLGYLDWFLDVNISSVSLSYQMGNLGTLGFHGMVIDYGEIEETRADQLFRDDVTGNYNPGLTNNIVSASSMVFGVSFARTLTNKFSFGLTTKFAREDLVAKSVNAIIFDGGITYETGFKSLKLGMMVRNFGAEVKYFNDSYPLPQTFVIGVSGYLIGPEAGAFISPSNTNNLLIAYDLSQTRDHSQQQHLGLEYALKDIVSLRGGYKFNFDEESWTLGFGIKADRFRLDYAYNDFGEFLGNVQRFTFNIIIK